MYIQSLGGVEGHRCLVYWLFSVNIGDVLQGKHYEGMLRRLLVLIELELAKGNDFGGSRNGSSHILW